MGSTTFTVTVYDTATGCTGTRSYTVNEISCPVITVTPAITLMTNLVQNVFYTNSFTSSPGAVISDQNPGGLVSSNVFSGVSGTITDITVALNITGGFNGDLYAYLLSPTGGRVVLLNRVGLNSSDLNGFGYDDAGFNITLSAAGNNIHNYQTFSYSLSSGQLTGTWAPDQRDILPNSDPNVFDAAPNGYNLNSYFGASPNGAWTLFIADLAVNNQSTLVSWGLTVVTIPEPQTWTLLVGGLTTLWVFRRRSRS